MTDTQVKRAGPVSAGQKAPAPEQTVVANDPVGSLFERRWRQECETSLLVADENRKLHALVRNQAAVIEELKKKLAAEEVSDGDPA